MPQVSKVVLSKGNSEENSSDSNINSDASLGNGNTGDSADSAWHTGHINGNTFRNKEVKYRIINGMAIFEGDIILAISPQEMERLSPEPKAPNEHELSVKPLLRAIVRKGDKLRWPRGEIPFTIASSLPNQQRVTDAINHWEERTPIRFIKRNDNNAQHYPNYVSFIQYVPNSNETQQEVFHCSSPIGMQNWGQQYIIISDRCVTGDVIHEIGHSVGLWHEQSREDRDNFIRINWDNIEDGIQPNGAYDSTKDMRHNFGQHIVDGDDIGEYDYCSIMHYGAWFFSKNGRPTIEPVYPFKDCANSLGQKNELSNGDIAAAAEMYGNLTPTILRNTDGRLEAFTIGSDKQLSHKQQKSVNSNDWDKDWTLLGLEQQFFSSGQRPAISRSSDGRLDVFWLRDNTRLHSYKDGPNSKWTPTQSNEIGGVDFEGDPVVAQNSNGSLELFMVHEDYSSNLYRLHHTSRDGASLPSLGGRWSPNARPAVAMTSDARLVVFMIGQDRQLYYRWQGMMNSNQWSDDWVPLGGPLSTEPPENRLSDPAVATDVEGRINVFFINSKDGRLYYRLQDSNDIDTGIWSSWIPLEGNWPVRKRISVAKNANGRLEAFIVGSDGRLYHRWQTIKNNSNNLWEWFMNWVPLGKQTWPSSSNPVVAQNADGRLEAFIVGSDGKLYHRWQTVPSNSSLWSESWVAL